MVSEELDAETISNLDIQTIEHCDGFRTLMRPGIGQRNSG